MVLDFFAAFYCLHSTIVLANYSKHYIINKMIDPDLATFSEVIAIM